jgi:Tol biopolymer transport system component
VSLTAGSKLGPYEIVAPLGAGGMGEVYRARDPRLGREVAIKVLPAHLSEHPEVRARFEREARTVSSLNHPHICVIHDVGRDGATDYLVMELVEGETLTQRLERGALPTAEVLRIGGQIADALDKAHRAGVVHRDLKPGNVMLTRAGAKLMDFGLARSTGLIAAGGSGSKLGVSQSPTVAAPLTAEGSIIGTFQYMSPEQLEGRETDARGDLWALGCVLYEMATGKRAFEGRSQASLIGAIMNHEPAPIAQVAPMAPPALDRLVRHLLAKDPEERIQSAHDVKLQLASMAESGSSWSAPAVAAPHAAPPRRAHLLLRLVPWAIAAFAVLVATGLLIGRAIDRSSAPTRTVIAAPPATRMHLTGDDSGPAVISPDGTRLVFAAIGQGAGSRLWLRRMDELVARPLTGTYGGQFPFWSPDSRSIGFFADAQLKRLDLDGGGVRTLAHADGARGGTWSKRGVILYTLSFTGGLWRVPASGGTPVVATTIDTVSETTHRWPQFMPDGDHFIYFAARHDDPVRTAAIWYGALSGGPARKILEVPNNAVYASGHLLYVRDSTLVAQRFDPRSGRLSGDPVTTAEIVKVDPTTWRAVLSASENGLLVYGLGGRSTPCYLTWFDRSGRSLGVVGEPANHISVALSADGTRAAVETQYTPNADLWVHNLASGVRTRITTDPLDETNPVWSPDGRQIAFTHQAGARDSAGLGDYALETVPADGLGDWTRLRAEAGQDLIPFAWWPDQSALLYGRGSYRGQGQGQLWRLRLADRSSEPLLPPSQIVSNADLSPDGRWIAFSSLTSGRPEIVVIAATPSGVKPDPNTRQWPLTSTGGDKPVWSRDSKRLYYMRPDGTLTELLVDGSGGDFRLRSETVLFQAFQREYVHSYDVAADGRFLIIVVGSDGGTPLAVVSHWTKTLRR